MSYTKTLRPIAMLVGAAAVASLTGCASIVSGTSQVISVETMQKAGPVAGARTRTGRRRR